MTTRIQWRAAWARVRRNREEMYTLVCRRGDVMRVWSVDCHGLRPVTAGMRREDIGTELARIRRLFKISAPEARDALSQSFHWYLSQGVAA